MSDIHSHSHTVPHLRTWHFLVPSYPQCSVRSIGPLMQLCTLIKDDNYILYFVLYFLNVKPKN